MDLSTQHGWTPGKMDLSTQHGWTPGKKDLSTQHGWTPGKMDLSTQHGWTPGKKDLSTQHGWTPGKMDLSTQHGWTPGKVDLSTQHGWTPGKKDLSTQHGWTPGKVDLSTQHGWTPGKMDLSTQHGWTPPKPFNKSSENLYSKSQILLLFSKSNIRADNTQLIIYFEKTWIKIFKIKLQLLSVYFLKHRSISIIDSNDGNPFTSRINSNHTINTMHTMQKQQTPLNWYLISGRVILGRVNEHHLLYVAHCCSGT